MLTMILVVSFLVIISLTSAFFHALPMNRVSRVNQKLSSVVLNDVLKNVDIALNLAETTGLSKKDIEKVLSAFSKVIHEKVLVGGDEIRIKDFGNFKQKKTNPRKGRNPRTREEVDILGTTTVSFKVASTLKVKDPNGEEAASEPLV